VAESFASCGAQNRSGCRVSSRFVNSRLVSRTLWCARRSSDRDANGASL
jgi:hypothetical protein